MMHLIVVFGFFLLWIEETQSFRYKLNPNARCIIPSSLYAAATITHQDLPPKLKSMVDKLKFVTDDKLRYQQLLFFASKAPAMPAALKTQENKVPGCLSSVFVHAEIDAQGCIQYIGDSDSQLTKGLVAMLVEGLSGSSSEVIQQVSPTFITEAGIAQSLTPGRNNGFLNMLQTMKKKAMECAERGKLPAETLTNTNDETSNKVDSNDKNNQESSPSISQSMRIKLEKLQPSSLEIIDDSAKHAGHAGNTSVRGSETHFTVRIVAACFDNLSLVQRHRLIYTLLADEMSRGIHALSISAKTPAEESSK
jgi:BolA-like protein 1